MDTMESMNPDNVMFTYPVCRISTCTSAAVRQQGCEKKLKVFRSNFVHDWMVSFSALVMKTSSSVQIRD